MNTARQIRFCFLLHKYNSGMDYGDTTMSQAINLEKIFLEYFHNMKALLRRLGHDTIQHVSEREQQLLVQFQTSRENVHIALMDDLDTPKVFIILQDLIKHCNRYVEDSPVVPSIILQIAKYITFILRCFGLVADATEIGFSMDSGSSMISGEEGTVGLSKENVLAPVLDALTKFRETVRLAAIAGNSAAVLSAADDLRDNILPDLGIRMEDKGSGTDVVTIWKLDDPEELRKEKLRKEELKKAKELQKLEQQRRLKEKEEKAKVPPQEMFRHQLDLYSSFDELTGLPLTDAKGEPLGKKLIKKLQKEMEKQKEVYDAAMNMKSESTTATTAVE